MKTALRLVGITAGLYVISYMVSRDLVWWGPPTAMCILGGMAYLGVSIFVDAVNSENASTEDILRSALAKGIVVKLTRVDQVYTAQVYLPGAVVPYVIESTRLSAIFSELNKCVTTIG